MREPGYYWVKFRGRWIISEWHKFEGAGSSLFFLPLISYGHDEKSMDEIDERKIERGIGCSCRNDDKHGETSIMCCNRCGKPMEDFWTKQNTL